MKFNYLLALVCVRRQVAQSPAVKEYAPAEHKLQPAELVAPAHAMQASHYQVTFVGLSARERCIRQHVALSPAN